MLAHRGTSLIWKASRTSAGKEHLKFKTAVSKSGSRTEDSGGVLSVCLHVWCFQLVLLSRSGVSTSLPLGKRSLLLEMFPEPSHANSVSMHFSCAFLCPNSSPHQLFPWFLLSFFVQVSFLLHGSLGAYLQIVHTCTFSWVKTVGRLCYQKLKC